MTLRYSKHFIPSELLLVGAILLVHGGLKAVHERFFHGRLLFAGDSAVAMGRFDEYVGIIFILSSFRLFFVAVKEQTKNRE